MDLTLLDAFQLPFMQRALMTILILSITAGVVGLGISMREMEFISDGLVHAVFPGLVIGVLVGGSAGLLPGALIAALLAAVLFTVLGRRQRVGTDAAIAVVFTGLFSLGIVIVSRQRGYVSQLQELLFGRLLTVSETQLWQIVGVSLLAIAIMVATARAQLFRAFDPAGFEAAGYRPLRTDLALTIATAMVVVAGVQALGVLLVIALLTVPMAVARLVTRRFAGLIPVAALVIFGSGFAGLWFSFDWSVRLEVSVAPGAIVVLFMITVYAVAVVVSGVQRAARRTRKNTPALTQGERANEGTLA